MPASRRARATTFTPRSCPSRPTLANRTRIGPLMTFLPKPTVVLEANAAKSAEVSSRRDGRPLTRLGRFLTVASRAGARDLRGGLGLGRSLRHPDRSCRRVVEPIAERLAGAASRLAFLGFGAGGGAAGGGG